ncbi:MULTISPECIES: glycosyltransferase family 1 protein [unclassified Synechocystis]|uniref:glycosyltransferase family 4 protein n=1 Tax=unclassified Synechocystis TaxID=2640012 RepID=UPI000402C021|nr:MULTISPECIES: glycosyltransferase family 1 protein [unclassified Synechocystis]AIE75145.1 Glycosyl transferase, group 1 [Synechocystis sp. PCC 6714]
MLKVCVDATAIRGQLSGIGFYNLSLLQALNKLQYSQQFQGQFSLQIYYQPGFKDWLRGRWQKNNYLSEFDHCICLPLPVTLSDRLTSFPNPILNLLEQCLGQPNLIHGTDHYIFPSQQSINLLTIHDLTFLKFPQFVPPIVQRYHQRILRCLPFVHGILTFAENTKREIIEYYQFPPEKIFVTPQASRYQGLPPSPTTSPLAFELSNDSLSARIPYNFQLPYFLFVSTLEPRKNIVGLISAFNLFKKATKAPHQLVLIGQLGWKYEPILTAIANSPYGDQIHRLAYVSNQWLGMFYQQATAFVYPSFYEGFGLPVVEAMNFGLPIITSNGGSLPEVVGDNGVLVDPQDTHALALALKKIVSDPDWQNQLRQKSLARSKIFSWDNTARKTLEVYRVLSN